jgi:hypothetical protein
MFLRFLKNKLLLCIFTALLLFSSATSLFAENISVNASSLLGRTELTLSPSSGGFVEGSQFDVQVLLNTKGLSVNGLQVYVNFDPSKLAIVRPLGGTSVIGVWAEPPTYDNVRGTSSYVGVLPNGMKTDSGLVATITFKAKKIGNARITFSSNSKVLKNDGLGTDTLVNLGKADLSIIPKAPDGVRVYSETHQFQDVWYNNNNPVLSWDRDPNVDGFSYVLDNKPNTVPENTITSNDTTKSYEKLSEGLWYFHIKAHKKGIWGGVGHFLIRIDSTPPAEFTPEANYLVASSVFVQKTLLSFVTTDSLSGVDHYEVGIIDQSKSENVSPVFIQTESPFQVPLKSKEKLHVIVRAIDKAGNVRDEAVDIVAPLVIEKFIKDNMVYILLFIILLGLVILITHYLFGHHIVRHLRRAFKIAQKEEEAEHSLETASKIPQNPTQASSDNTNQLG